MGSALIQPEQRVAQERLQLRIAVGAASERVALSYPRFDVRHNRARVPSFYGLEALRALEGTLPAFEEFVRRTERGAAARLGWPAPETPSAAIDDAEYDLAALARVRASSSTRRGKARYFLLSNPHLARALRFRARRWSTSRFGMADGLVLGEGERALLANHQLDARSYSATALSQFAACPYRFYLHAIMGVAPREESLELDELDARQRGLLFHTTQRLVLEALRDAHLLPVPASERDRAMRTLSDVFERVALAAREEYAPAIPRVFDAALEGTRTDLRRWLTRLSAEREWVATHMELGFGRARAEPNQSLLTWAARDPASRGEPVRLASGLALSGAIDVVERRAVAANEGRAVLRATDFKTGAIPDKLGTISGGRVLQPALYALALEQLFAGAEVQGGRLYFCSSHAGFAEHEVPLDARARDACLRLTDAVGGALSLGFLPAAPAEGECTHCAYQTVCGPHEEERVARIKLRDHERLKPLVRLRMVP